MALFSNSSVATAVASPNRGATVFVVDDDADVRRSISLLARSVGLNAELFASPHDFLEAYDPHNAGCLVLDMRMPGMTGLKLQQELQDRDIRLPIIFVTAHGEIPTATAAMRAGAVDFITKPFSPQLLLERIQEAISINDKDRRAAEIQRDVAARIATLTNREREVMELLAEGMTTKLIAARLRISAKTVDNHRARILDKMNADNSAQLANLVGSIQVRATSEGEAPHRAALTVAHE